MVGAVVVVGEAEVPDVAVFAVLVPGVEDEAVEVVAWGEATVVDAVPGISFATSPPRMAAVSAAPPVAMPVTRLTLRSAAVLCSA